MGRNKNKNRQKRLKKQNEKLLTALTAASTQASAATTAATAGDANANNNDKGTTETTTMMTCYHGSDEGIFAKGSDYQMIVDEWVSLYKKRGTPEYRILYQKFTTKHINLLKDPDFFTYIFAYTTDMFRNSYGSGKYSPSFKHNLRRILNLGIESKYCYSLLYTDREKSEKFVRDIKTDRGIINVLHRETSPFCTCMEPLKSEAKKMEKVGICYKCKQEFPKKTLKRCNRCDHAQYCSNKCQKNDWPRHKQFCTPHHKSEA